MAGFFTAFAGGFAAQTNENIKTNEARRAEMIRDAMADFRAHIADRQKQIEEATKRRAQARGDARATGMSVDQAEALRAEGYTTEELRGGQVSIAGGAPSAAQAPSGPAPNTPQAIPTAAPTAQQQPVTETPTSTMGNPATAQAVGMPEADPATMSFSAQAVGQAPPQAQAAPMADPREQAPVQAQAPAQTQAPAQAPQRGLGASVLQSLFGGPDVSGVQAEVRNRYMQTRGMSGDQLAALERGAPSAPTFEGRINYNPINAEKRWTEENTQRRADQANAVRLQAAAMRAAAGGERGPKPADMRAAQSQIYTLVGRQLGIDVKFDGQGNPMLQSEDAALTARANKIAVAAWQHNITEGGADPRRYLSSIEAAQNALNPPPPRDDAGTTTVPPPAASGRTDIRPRMEANAAQQQGVEAHRRLESMKQAAGPNPSPEARAAIVNAFNALPPAVQAEVRRRATQQ